MSGDRSPAVDDLRDRNRWVLRVILTIIASLVVASLLVGVRW
jgi:hypothetical protein